MAGIIAGRGTTNPSTDLPSAPAGVQLGVAPDAELLALKLATTDGSTDVSQVIAALDWVTEHPVLPDGTRVRVINLSYGTASTQDYQLDPLAAAAENAWKHGIVVVASAGNDGTTAAGLTDPAYDPYLLAVGAADSGDRIDGWAHDHTRTASFSNVSATRHVDLIAPGTSLVSLRDPGSYIDTNNPEGLVAGDRSGRLFRGSGTSQAAAVVSGAVADLLQAFPGLHTGPGQVRPCEQRCPCEERNCQRRRCRRDQPRRCVRCGCASHCDRQDSRGIAVGRGTELPGVHRAGFDRRGARGRNPRRPRREPDHRRGRRPGRPLGSGRVVGCLVVPDRLERWHLDGVHVDR